MKTSWTLRIFFGMIITGLVVCVYLDAMKSLRCGDFRVQGDAQLFYWLGAHQLDGWDQDGKACEDLLDPRAGTAYF